MSPKGQQAVYLPNCCTCPLFSQCYPSSYEHHDPRSFPHDILSAIFSCIFHQSPFAFSSHWYLALYSLYIWYILLHLFILNNSKWIVNMSASKQQTTCLFWPSSASKWILNRASIWARDPRAQNLLWHLYHKPCENPNKLYCLFLRTISAGCNLRRPIHFSNIISLC